MTKNNVNPGHTIYEKIGAISAVAAVIVAIIVYLWPPPPPPDFELSINPLQSAIPQGGTINAKISVKCINNYNYDVTLNSSEQSSDIVVSFNPITGKPEYNSDLTMNVGASVPAGDYSTEIKATGSDGKVHTCTHKMTVKPSIKIISQEIPILQPIDPYSIYNDSGIAGGNIQVWSGADWGLDSPIVIGNYEDENSPEGITCFASTSGSGSKNYVGWGVFLGVFNNNHRLITAHTIDLSGFKNLIFSVKTSVNLKVEIQQDNAEGQKSSPCLISRYGWNSRSPDTWQQVVIPISAFRNVNFTKVFCPFMITGNGGGITFYIDDVKWEP